MLCGVSVLLAWQERKCSSHPEQFSKRRSLKQRSAAMSSSLASRPIWRAKSVPSVWKSLSTQTCIGHIGTLCRPSSSSCLPTSRTSQTTRTHKANLAVTRREVHHLIKSTDFGDFMLRVNCEYSLMNCLFVHHIVIIILLLIIPTFESQSFEAFMPCPLEKQSGSRSEVQEWITDM